MYTLSVLLPTLLAIAGLVPGGAAAHRRTHTHPARDSTAKDSTALCGQNDLTQTQNFILYNNLWGEGSATSGSQCTYLDYQSGSTISWHTEWTWEGGTGQVKSYPNAVLNIGATQLSAINGLPSTFNWSCLLRRFLSSQASTTATHEYEVMVWLASLGGAEPIGYGDGPVATPNIGGVAWNLYKGSNSWTVFSFVAQSTINDYSGDMNAFFQYLVQNQGVADSQYLQTIGAGTEPFTGDSATFNVSPYSIYLE
ncbi:concanavalin A-like lectin/glucanase [Penicillium chermesinum]|nr:concanavalin A-like lectin/glucanase [Penicillium chermesinum]